jgi:hypothetical protein
MPAPPTGAPPLSIPPLLAVVEHLAILVRHLLLAIGNNQIGRIFGGKVPGPLVVPISVRLVALRDRFARLAARIVAGTYRPRRSTPRRSPGNSTPRRKTPFQESGWLDAMLPAAVAQQFRSHLHALLREPEMAALIRVAPVPMARVLRPLCWMLGVKPPATLASPGRAADAPPAVRYEPPPPPPPPIPGPANTLGLHPIQLAPPKAPPKPT